MANKFKTISKKFYNQFRNYDFSLSDWTLNLTEFTTRLQGGVGETAYMEQVIEIGTIVNEEKGVPQEFIEGQDLIRANLYDYEAEGLYNGAALSIEFDNETITATCEGITNGGSDLCIDSVASTAIAATNWGKKTTRQDVIIKVTNAPDYLLYKYGVNPNSLTTPTYKSPLDGNEQSYQLQGITGTAQDMTFSGKEIGSSLGTVTIKFDSTSDYLHQYTLTHEFVIPYYTEGQFTNISEESNPEDLKRNNSLRYGNGFFFGGLVNDTVLQYEDLGEIGNVGYFGDQYNGFDTNYEASGYAVSNTSGTGTLEATETNTVTFTIQDKPTGLFSGGERIVLVHSKLPNTSDYSNSKTAFDTTWIRETIELTEGAGAATVGIFSNATVTLNAGNLDVSVDIDYTAAQQELLSDNTAASIYFTIATRDLSDPDLQDRSTLIAKAEGTSKNTEQKGLIGSWQPNIYKPTEFDGGVGYTDFNGWDGDLAGQDWTFTLDISDGSFITGAKFMVVADDGTDFFELSSVSIPFTGVTFIDLFSEQFQVYNTNIENSFNIPTSELLNRIKFNAIIPGAPTTLQTWSGSIGFQVPHRDWILNSNVPISFYDPAEPNNNQNEKTSIYSAAAGYDIKTVLQIQVQTPDNANQTTITTVYDLVSDSTNISDFDMTAGSFTGDVKLYDLTGDEVDDLFTNETTRIEVEFTHTLGTLSLANLEGYIWIETENDTSQPWFLHSDIDFTSPQNPLVPSDTLASGNSTLVEVVSVNNLVTLICDTNKFLLTEGQSYRIYGRLDTK